MDTVVSVASAAPPSKALIVLMLRLDSSLVYCFFIEDKYPKFLEKRIEKIGFLFIQIFSTRIRKILRRRVIWEGSHWLLWFNLF